MAASLTASMAAVLSSMVVLSACMDQNDVVWLALQFSLFCGYLLNNVIRLSESAGANFSVQGQSIIWPLVMRACCSCH